MFELPYRYFPEAPQMGTLGPYDLVRPYLHSDSLKWSFGGMLGRDADWQASTAALPARQMLDRVAAIGFDGLLYDTGSTTTAARHPSTTSRRCWDRRLDSASDLELAFWDLRDYRRELRDRIGADGIRELRRRALADRSEPAS